MVLKPEFTKRWEAFKQFGHHLERIRGFYAFKNSTISINDGDNSTADSLKEVFSGSSFELHSR